MILGCLLLVNHQYLQRAKLRQLVVQILKFAYLYNYAYLIIEESFSRFKNV